MGLETYCCFSSDFSTSFPIAAWGGWLCCQGLQQLWPWQGESPELVGLGSWSQELLLPTPDFQSHQFGWGAVLVQSRNSWKHYAFPDGLMAHLMEVNGEVRHWSDLFCSFRDECVKGDALVMSHQNFLLEVRTAKVLQWAGGDSLTSSQGCHGPLWVTLTLSQHSHCGTKLLHTVTFGFFSIVCLWNLQIVFFRPNLMRKLFNSLF